jgi:phosphoglycolate phosphatase
MSRTFRAILFDLDGTLVDSLPGITWAARAALLDVLPGSELPDLRPFVGPPIRKIFRHVLGVGASGILDDLEAAFRRYYNSEGWRHTVAYADVSETLGALYAAGMRLGVVTNKPLAPTRSILSHLDLARFMETVVTPDSVTPACATKTETLAAALAAQAFIPAQALFVGDSLDDAAAAAACGLPFAAVTYGYGDAARQIVHPIHVTLDSLAALLRPLPFNGRVADTV